MSTVTIYHITYQLPNGEQTTAFSLYPCFAYEHIKGYDDGGRIYNLPEGHWTGRDELNNRKIFAPDGTMCQINKDDSSGRPALFSSRSCDIYVLDDSMNRLKSSDRK